MSASCERAEAFEHWIAGVTGGLVPAFEKAERAELADGVVIEGEWVSVVLLQWAT